MSYQDAIRVFYLRHRSLESTKYIWLTFNEISKALNIPLHTCYQALKRFKQSNGTYPNNRKLGAIKSAESRKKIKSPLRELLLSRDKLQEWSGLSLRQRCAKIEVLHNTKLTPATLSRFYQKNKVGYLTTSYIYQ